MARQTVSSRLHSPALCKWTAEALITSFLQECRGGGDICNKRKLEGGAVPSPGKRPRVEVEEKEMRGVNPMDPSVPGGRGPPRSCKWKGLEAHFHDGGGLASPGRWTPRMRTVLDGEEWVTVRRLLLLEAVRALGSVAEVEKEAFRMAKGGDSFKLVRDERFLEKIRNILSDKLGIRKQYEPEPGQPFFLDLMKGILEKVLGRAS